MAQTRTTNVLRKNPVPKSSKSIKVSKKKSKINRKKQNNELDDQLCRSTSNFTKGEMKTLKSHYLTVSKYVTEDQRTKWAEEWTEAGGDVLLKRKNIRDWFIKNRQRVKWSVAAREQKIEKKESEKKPEAPKQKVIKLDVLTPENEEDLLNFYKNTKNVTLQNMMGWSQDLGVSIHTVVDWIMNQKPLENLVEVIEIRDEVREDPDDVREDPEDPEDVVIVELEEEEILKLEQDEKDEENHVPGEVESDECLLLRNRSKTDCFMNTIANLLYSCRGVRSVICNPDLYQEGSPLANILLKLFWKESNSTRKWRKTLRDETYHSGHQDVGEIFEALIEDLCKDVNLSPMEFKTLTETKCNFCHFSQHSTTIQYFSILKLTRHETFNNLLTEEYTPQPVSKCSCGGDMVEKRTITPIGSYHFMVIRHEIEKFSNLKSEEIFKMFGCSWRIRSFAEYLPAKKENKGEKGHYVTWINTGVDWMCVNDNNNTTRRKKLDLSETCVNLIAFERFDYAGNS